jgi:hypothetical protein
MAENTPEEPKRAPACQYVNGTFIGQMPPEIGYRDVEKAFDKLKPQDDETKLAIMKLLLGGRR